ncbi:hypothetical protein [Pseudomonas sp.]|uniref:hypothetical protein n=1 Tax=Pseudomonas sp. TaxID=306 RepID=UPI003CC510DD
MPTIMIRHATDADVHAAKSFTNEHGSAARAFVSSVALGVKYRDRYLSEQAEAARLREEVAVLRQTLEQARSAAIALVERCGQGDLISG